MKRAILFFLVIVLIFPVISACSSAEAEISVYFRDANVSELCIEKRKIDKDMSVKEKADFAISELIKGPENESNDPVISKDAEIIGLEIVNNVATINISKHYHEKKGTDELLLRRAINSTLCSIDGIDKVVIQIEGVNLVDGEGKEIPPLGNEDYVDPQNAQIENVKLYFPNSDGTALGSEVRNIEIQNMPSIEKAVVTELINGPKDKSLSKAIPDGTKLLGIEIKDKVCYVNFSKEFVNNAGSSSYETTMIVYSVVNSLCELDTVDSVQILIEGKTGEEFGNFVFDIPHDANYDYCE